MCGDCCRRQGSPPFADELDTCPKEIRAIVDWFAEHDPYRYDHGRVCYFLSTEDKCLIYPYRPLACREFEPGGNDIGENAICPQSSPAEKWMANFEEQVKAEGHVTIMGRKVKLRFFAEQLGRTIARNLRNDLSRILRRIRRR